ncbi:MAG: hypothetical protein K9N52_10175, partial [Verrucomicrobia bacterium]|nr:hypothetical protein [Verrucomicrobiota bacterium]
VVVHDEPLPGPRSIDLFWFSSLPPFFVAKPSTRPGVTSCTLAEATRYTHHYVKMLAHQTIGDHFQTAEVQLPPHHPPEYLLLILLKQPLSSHYPVDAVVYRRLCPCLYPRCPHLLRLSGFFRSNSMKF